MSLRLIEYEAINSIAILTSSKIIKRHTRVPPPLLRVASCLFLIYFFFPLGNTNRLVVHRNKHTLQLLQPHTHTHLYITNEWGSIAIDALTREYIQYLRQPADVKSIKWGAWKRDEFIWGYVWGRERRWVILNSVHSIYSLFKYICICNGRFS